MHHTSLAILPNIGWTEALVILTIFILLFGAKKLPELARSMGKSIKEFKKATSNVEEEIRSAMDENEQPKKPAATPGETRPKSIVKD